MSYLYTQHRTPGVTPKSSPHAAFYDWEASRTHLSRHQRTFSVSRSVLLLTHSPEGLDDEKLYGVVVPGLLFGGALLMGYFHKDR